MKRTTSQSLRWMLVGLLSLAACKKDEASSGADAGPAAAAGEDAPSAEGGDEEPASDLPSAESILAKAVEAVGGREKLDEVDSFYYKANVKISPMGIEGPVEIWWKDGDFYMLNVVPGVGKIQEGKKGELIWQDDPINGLRELEGPEAEQHAWAAALMLTADWKEHFETAQTVAERTVDGTKVYDVELKTDSGAKLIMTFDADSGLQVAQRYEQVLPTGAVPLEVTMSDYRDVEGIKIAFEQKTDASVAQATQTLETVEINPEVDESKFAMPTGGAEVVTKDEAKKPTAMPFGPDGKPGRPVPEKD